MSIFVLKNFSSRGSAVATASSMSEMKLFDGIFRALIAPGLALRMSANRRSSDTNCQPMSSGLSEKNKLM
ncbi:hypothetical protein D3C86_1920410 [compost metagenome]